jgi:hypothetical protein
VDEEGRVLGKVLEAIVSSLELRGAEGQRCFFGPLVIAYPTEEERDERGKGRRESEGRVMARHTQKRGFDQKLSSNSTTEIRDHLQDPPQEHRELRNEEINA